MFSNKRYMWERKSVSAITKSLLECGMKGEKSMGKSPMYSNSLRGLIDMAGYSVKEVAKAAHISERTLHYWAAGDRIIPHEDRIVLARILECTVEDLAPHQKPQGMAELPEDSSQPQGQEGINKKRRELFQLLSIASGILVLPDVDWERIDQVVNKPSLLDETGLCDLEAINQHYWAIYLTSFTKIAVLDGVLGQLKTLIGLLQTTSSTPLYRGLDVLVCDLVQLAGEIFFDINDYNSAQFCYTFAVEYAKEAKHWDLWACALVRNAFLPIHDKNYQNAFPLLEQAERIARRGDGTLVTRYWVAAVSAEAHAGNGKLVLCQKSLDLAEKVRDIQKGDNGGWLRFDASRLPEQRGTCFVSLKEPSLAIPALNEALAQNAKPTRRRGMVLHDLAQSALQQRNVEQACVYAHRVIEIALHNSSGMLKRRLYTLRGELEPFAQTDSVKQLDKHLNGVA
jgi:hypothetical protein